MDVCVWRVCQANHRELLAHLPTSAQPRQIRRMPITM